MRKMKPVPCCDYEIDLDKCTPIHAIGWKCMDCCAGMREEVKRCENNECVLHEFRLKGLKNMMRCNANKRELTEAQKNNLKRNGFSNG